MTRNALFFLGLLLLAGVVSAQDEIVTYQDGDATVNGQVITNVVEGSVVFHYPRVGRRPDFIVFVRQDTRPDGSVQYVIAAQNLQTGIIRNWTSPDGNVDGESCYSPVFLDDVLINEPLRGTIYTKAVYYPQIQLTCDSGVYTYNGWEGYKKIE